MNGLNRRRFLGSVAAHALGLGLSAGLLSAPARAAKSKPVAFDISGSQFRDMCSLAGGEFADWGGGDYTCYMDGWRMECSRVTGKCRIICDAGVPCIKAKRLAPRAPAALKEAAASITVAR
jgi:hypothetical protein